MPVHITSWALFCLGLTTATVLLLFARFLSRKLVYSGNVTKLTARRGHHVEIDIQHHSKVGGLWFTLLPQKKKMRLWRDKSHSYSVLQWCSLVYTMYCFFLCFCDWLLLFQAFSLQKFRSNTINMTFTKKRKCQPSSQ